MSQADMIRAAQEVCQRAEDIEAEPLHILTPDNELLQTLVDDFQKRVWGHMTQTQMRCLYELQKSNVGGIVKNGSERMVRVAAGKKGQDNGWKMDQQSLKLTILSHRHLPSTRDPDALTCLVKCPSAVSSATTLT